MNYQTEAKPQCWRAVAVFDDRPEMLLYLNRSSPQDALDKAVQGADTVLAGGG